MDKARVKELVADALKGNKQPYLVSLELQAHGVEELEIDNDRVCAVLHNGDKIEILNAKDFD